MFFIRCPQANRKRANHVFEFPNLIQDQDEESFFSPPSLANKAKWANKVRRVDRRTNALPDRRTQPVIEVLCRT